MEQLWKPNVSQIATIMTRVNHVVENFSKKKQENSLVAIFAKQDLFQTGFKTDKSLDEIGENA